MNTCCSRRALSFAPSTHQSIEIVENIPMPCYDWITVIQENYIQMKRMVSIPDG